MQHVLAQNWSVLVLANSDVNKQPLLPLPLPKRKSLYYEPVMNSLSGLYLCINQLTVL